MSEELLKTLANETNQAILNLLAVEPSYPRQVSDLLSIGESDASRRLARMERQGLLESSWEHIGKNVKLYRLVPRSLRVGFTAEGLTIDLEDVDQEPLRTTVLDKLQLRIPEVEGFVGREDETALLEGPDPVVLVEGLAGIGKTSLLAAYAHRAREEDPVFFHSFRGTESLTWLAHRLAVFQARHDDRDLLDAIETGAPLADRRELMLQSLEAGTGVIVLDAVERIRDPDLEELLVDAIDRVRAGKLVCAGRSLPRFDPTAEHLRTLRLDGLTDEGVRRFLDDRGLEVDDKLLPRIRTEVGGHPLALNLLVETARELETPIETLLDRVPEQGLETYLLEEVHGHLSDPERQVLAHASVFPARFTREDLDAIYPGNPGGALVKLRRRRLLREDQGSFTLHEVLKNFFYDQLEDPSDLHEKAAERALNTGTLEARLEAMEHYLAAGRRTRVLDLLEEDLDLEDFDVIEDGYHNLYLGVLERLDPDEVADPRQAGLILDEMGDIRFHRDEHERALDRYDAARERFADQDAPERLADLAWKEGLALRALGRSEEARDRVRDGLTQAPATGLARERLEELAEDLEVRSETS